MFFLCLRFLFYERLPKRSHSIQSLWSRNSASLYRIIEIRHQLNLIQANVKFFNTTSARLHSPLAIYTLSFLLMTDSNNYSLGRSNPVATLVARLSPYPLLLPSLPSSVTSASCATRGEHIAPSAPPTEPTAGMKTLHALHKCSFKHNNTV